MKDKELKETLKKPKKVYPYFCQLCGGHEESMETHVKLQKHMTNKQAVDDWKEAAPLRAPMNDEERWPNKS